MGYKLPDGRYVDDQGRTHRNYNDAAASAKTRRERGQTEQLLSNARAVRQQANDNLWQGQVNKSLLGWIPGYGEALDRGMAANAKQKQAADDAIRAREGQLGIYKARMGEAAAPPTVDRRQEPGSGRLEPPGGPGPGLSAPTAYGDPAQRARDSEALRMMQQYASKEYWETEQGKAMRGLALQDQYKGQDLAGYYKAQRALGEGSIDEIIAGMGYTGDMANWARANKAMALREYMKKYPGGEPTLGSGGLSVPKIDTASPTAGEKALMDAKYQLSGDDGGAGIELGNLPGATAQDNRNRMASLQAVVPQAQATGAGQGAFKMQPESAAATGYQLPAESFGKFNIPGSPNMTWDDLVELKKKELQNTALAGYSGQTFV